MAYHGKYTSPADLLLDENLSHDEKITMLEDWREDKEALMRAADEGMPGDTRANLLKKIENALIALRENPRG